MAYTIKLNFNNDFTKFLEIQDYNAPVCVLTESETIQCYGLLLAQHSSVLREYLKKDKELFLTDNKHVRECLSILYGGSVELTEDNFHDILKFMVCFDIPSIRDQVLDWMSQNRWNLDNASLLVNCTSDVGKASRVQPTVSLSLKDDILKPCRLFFSQHLVTKINPNSRDIRYQTLGSAMKSILLRIGDKSKFIDVLLHQDLIPEYVPWITELINQSSYDTFLNRLEQPEIANKMPLLTRTQFENLFDKIEDFECMTLKEYKRLNKYKLNINEKMAVVQSLRFMKGNGSLYSCWKILDGDGMTIFKNAFTDKSDQFCIIECLLSWYSANKSPGSKDILETNLLEALRRLIQGPGNSLLQNYWSTYLVGLSGNKQVEFPKEVHTFNQINGPVIFYEAEDIVMELQYGKYYTSNYTGQIQFQIETKFLFKIRFSKNRVPDVSAVDPNEIDRDGPYFSRHELGRIGSYGNYKTYVYAFQQGYSQKIPLYCDPSEAFKIIQKGMKRESQYSTFYDDKETFSIPGVNFFLLFIGV